MPTRGASLLAVGQVQEVVYFAGRDGAQAVRRRGMGGVMKVGLIIQRWERHGLQLRIKWILRWSLRSRGWSLRFQGWSYRLQGWSFRLQPRSFRNLPRSEVSPSERQRSSPAAAWQGAKPQLALLSTPAIWERRQICQEKSFRRRGLGNSTSANE